MAITIRDIQEKEFAKQKLNGYDVEEVDDFLDEIADQLGDLIRENLSLVEAAKKAAEQPVEKPQPVVEVKPEVSAYDEPSYFKNLELAMRETLISSQRIADETVAEARKQAQEIVAAAQQKADEIETTAKAELNAAKAEIDSLRRDLDGYRVAARKMLDQQQAALDAMKTTLD